MNKPIDITGVILKTERMILRPWRQEDLEDFYAYASVEGVGQMAGWLPHENREKSQMILNHFIEEKKTFALEYQGRVIGSLGIEEYKADYYPHLDTLQGRSIGYVLAKDHWGKGLMPEAVKRVMQWLWDEVGLDFIMISHFDWNRQSARVIEKCALEYVDTTPFMTRYGKQETSRNYIAFAPSRP